MTRRNWSYRILIGALITAMITVCSVGSANGETVVGSSSMAVFPASAGGQVSDWWSGPVVKLWSNGAVSVPVVTANPGGRIDVRARGENCFGAPVVSVKRGGVTLTRGSVGSGWNTYIIGLGPQTGSAPVTVEFTNDYRGWFCDRNVYIASVTVRDGAGTVVPPTTTPPTTVPPTVPPTMTVPPTTPVPPTTTVPPTVPPTTTAPPVPSTRCPLNMFEARYFNNTAVSGSPAAVQCENAPGGSFTGSPLSGVNADGFSVEYVGAIEFPQTTSYIVSATLGNVGARVWIDDALVLDRPNAQWGTFNTPQTVAAGVHRVRVAYANPSGVAHFGFSLPRATPGAPSNNGNYFAADSPWNQPVPSNATVDPRSAGWIATVDAGSNGVWVNSQDWSTTVYNAPPGTPTTDIYVSDSNRRLTIPYTTAYRPTQDRDAHLAVIDDATGCLYEFQSFDPWNRRAIASATYRAYTGSGGHVASPAHAGGEFSYLAG